MKKFLTFTVMFLVLTACSHNEHRLYPDEFVRVEVFEFPLEMVEKITVNHGKDQPHDIYFLYALKESGSKYCQKSYGDRQMNVDLDYCQDLKHNYFKKKHDLTEEFSNFKSN